ncbi:hypothetical protein QTI04_18115 [Variovorax sp. J22R115]|nr:hypothetical protein [Variovorax sp. J22R115]
MKRRFRHGVELPDVDFHAQEWVRGMLQFERERLYLCQSTPGHNPPPFGVLYRPTLKSCFNDTFAFAGIEQEGRQWMAQVWFCEVGSGRAGN